jgi:two-component system, chemotaxis family, chemotaxis protein CheY
MNHIRTFLVDDSADFLESAAQFLAADPKIEIVGRSLSGSDAVARVAALRPDLVIMDLAMPGVNGLEATKAIKAQARSPRVIILTLYDAPEYREAATAVGADGFLPKSEFGEQLVDLIHQLGAAGQQRKASREVSMKNILVVDDSATMRRMVQACLSRLPYLRFWEANSGLQAIEQLALAPIRLIVLDLNMPDMHGLEVLEFVRKHQAYRDIPVIVLTTRGDEASREAVTKAGGSVYLTKPFQPDELVQHVTNLINSEPA